MPNLPGAGKLPGGMRAKPRHQTKYRLPALNWKALKPNQVEGTVFKDLDDDAILNEVRDIAKCNLCLITARLFLALELVLFYYVQ